MFSKVHYVTGNRNKCKIRSVDCQNILIQLVVNCEVVVRFANKINRGFIYHIYWQYHV